MNNPKTIDEALALVPTHILLRPGVDVWREGDDFLITHDRWMKNTWEKAFSFKMVQAEEQGRRLIPEEIRIAMAERMFKYSTLDNFKYWNQFESWLLSSKPEGK
jgi:hypothetical protein